MAKRIWTTGFLGMVIAFGLGTVFLLRLQANNDVVVTVTNIAPTVVVGSEKFCTGTVSTGNDANGCSNLALITPPAGGVVVGQLLAIVRDTNGYLDIDTAQAKFYLDTGPESEACTADLNTCLEQTACTFIGQHSGQAATDQWVKCPFGIQYYSSDSSDGAPGDEIWKGYITVQDQASASGSNVGSEYTTEVAKVIALTFPDVAFGSKTLGSSTVAGTNVNLQHNNLGNVNVDLQVSLDDDDANSQVDCASGGIPVGNVEWNVDLGATAGDLDYNAVGNTDLVDENDGGAPQTINATICRRTNDSAAQGPTNPRTSGGGSDQDCTVTNTNADDQVYTYWNIAIPLTGAVGSCTEGLNFTAVEG